MIRTINALLHAVGLDASSIGTLLLSLSTIAGAKISNPSWVNFQSAGWVSFQSAPTGKGDSQISEPNVVPSYLDLNGDKVSYGQYVLKQNVYYSLLPIHNDTHPIKISTTIKKKSLQPSGDIYYNCSRSVAKNQGIDFKVRFMYKGGSSDIQVKFRVENYGIEASLEKANGNHSILVPARRNEQGWYFSHHWEGTSYTGLHYMFVSVEVDGVVLYPEQRYAIYIGDRK